MSNLAKKYKVGLEYLKKTGFDHIVIEVGVFGTEVYKYKPHSRFDNEKKDLPNPCQFRDFVLTKKLMDHYKIKTKVDIARYLRIISIILTNFSLPDEYDYFEIHRKRLRVHLQKETFKEKQNKRLAVREALSAYDEAFSSSITLPLKDYEDFTEILNLFYSIYVAVKEIELTKREKEARVEANKKGIDLMIVESVGSKGDLFGDWDDYDDDDAGTTEYKEPDIMWAYEGLYKDYTEEKLIASLKNNIKLNTLLDSLNSVMNIPGYSIGKLKELLNNESERKKLVKKIREWHKKTFSK
ncbi:unnamed protein product [marine sediment metagenome]|uniref:Uncharacterized protein n=1 Tax=marine sediment metagenome TaxID=412755 RepID=X1TSQ0_9ZZZZ